MPKICYIARKFSPASLELIQQANGIINTYTAQGYQLTLRQLYYQFVSRDLLDNTVNNYKRLGSVINDARLAGLIDWNSIEDRTRNLESLAHWADPSEIVSAVAQQFRIDLWATQPNRVEVWIEKEALAGVFERVCNEYAGEWGRMTEISQALEVLPDLQPIAAGRPNTVVAARDTGLDQLAGGCGTVGVPQVGGEQRRPQLRIGQPILPADDVLGPACCGVDHLSVSCSWAITAPPRSYTGDHARLGRVYHGRPSSCRGQALLPHLRGGVPRGSAPLRRFGLLSEAGCEPRRVVVAAVRTRRVLPGRLPFCC